MIVRRAETSANRDQANVTFKHLRPTKGVN
jgi:hypothetical protein